MQALRGALLGLVCATVVVTSSAQAYHPFRWRHPAVFPPPYAPWGVSFLQIPVQPSGGDNYAYYSGNYLPAQVWNPNTDHGRFNRNDYWKNNVYWKYFKQVWGDAPFADANFQLWMNGMFHKFDLPRQTRYMQSTKALPAWMHYYDRTYDPLLDPPYTSEYSLFAADGSKAPAAAGEAGSEAVMDDCSNGAMQRPCGVAERQRWTTSRSRLQRESPDGLASGYVKLDNYWAKSTEEMPANMPPPPKDPPNFKGTGDGTPPIFSYGEPGEQDSKGSGS